MPNKIDILKTLEKYKPCEVHFCNVANLVALLEMGSYSDTFRSFS